jgi:hypothetical protein
MKGPRTSEHTFTYKHTHTMHITRLSRIQPEPRDMHGVCVAYSLRCRGYCVVYLRLLWLMCSHCGRGYWIEYQEPTHTLYIQWEHISLRRRRYGRGYWIEYQEPTHTLYIQWEHISQMRRRYSRGYWIECQEPTHTLYIQWEHISQRRRRYGRGYWIECQEPTHTLYVHTYARWAS